MDPAVALVDAYLQINGYFTVVEYPVIAASSVGGYEEITDLDILAFRFALAGRLVPRRDSTGTRLLRPDPKLGVAEGAADMLVIEVKQGRASLNPPARDHDVLLTALTRFGCCDPDEAEDVAARVRVKGRAVTCDGHIVRALAFGARERRLAGTDRVISLGHVRDYLTTHLERNWEIYRAAQFRHPALGLLMALHKASRVDGASS